MALNIKENSTLNNTEMILNMKKECQGREMATFFKGLARKLIKKSIEKEK